MLKTYTVLTEVQCIETEEIFRHYLIIEEETENKAIRWAIIEAEGLYPGREGYKILKCEIEK
jgi:hypothetical protein